MKNKLEKLHLLTSFWHKQIRIFKEYYQKLWSTIYNRPKNFKNYGHCSIVLNHLHDQIWAMIILYTNTYSVCKQYYVFVTEVVVKRAEHLKLKVWLQLWMDLCFLAMFDLCVVKMTNRFEYYIDWWQYRLRSSAKIHDFIHDVCVSVGN